MIRGTTPTIEFNVSIDTSLLSVAYITFSQNKQVVFEKTLEDCTVTENKISVKLTQAETLELSSGAMSVEIQIRARTTDNTAVATDIFKVPVEEILKDGVI